MNIWSSFAQGHQVGRGLRASKDARDQRNNTNNFNKMLYGNQPYVGTPGINPEGGSSRNPFSSGQSNAQQARQYAIDNNMWDQVKHLDAAQAEQTASASAKISAIARATKGLAPEKRMEFARYALQKEGLNPSLADQVPGWDDASLTAIARSTMDTARQLDFALKEGRFSLDTRKQDEVERSALENEADKDFSNQTSRINALTARDNAEQRRQAPEKFGLTPIYGRDEEGNRVLIQTNSAGGVRAANIPEGVQLEDEFFKKRQGELGKGRAKLELGRTKAGASLQTALLKRDRLVEDLRKAIDTSDGGTTGVIGGRLALTNGQKDFDALIDSVKARIGFSELQDMRDNSPTGGALGQVTEREIEFLQALKGSIDRRQSEGRLDDNLLRIIGDIEASYARIEAAYQQDYESGLFDNDGVNAPRETESTGLPPGFELD